MFSSLLSRIATVAGVAALATAALVGSAGTAEAAGLCQLDRPCTNLSYNSSTATITGLIGSNTTEFYQIRWTINRNGAVQSFPQQRVNWGDRPKAYFGPIAPADRSFAIGYSAQSCTTDFFGYAQCSPWETKTIVPLPYGPDTCAKGYVWRDAFVGDHICVTPASRNQAASDNAAAASRVNPQGAYGPNTCVNGYVWRVARSTDLVCVTPAVRTQTANENANPNAHRA